MVTWDYHIILHVCGFSFKEIEIISVGIRAILDPRMRPFGLDNRIRSGTCLFGYMYRPCIFLCMAYLFSNLLIPFYGMI
jgi:hypothetical protein